MESFELEAQRVVRVNPIVKFDLAFSQLCVGHRYSNQVGQLSRAISHSGDGHLYPVIALMAWISDPVLGKFFFVCGLIAFAIELPIYWAAKNAFRRRRPHEFSNKIDSFIEPSDKYSMPSGHTAAAFIMATLICLFFPSLAPIAVSWAVMIALSRILLGVHFFSDIVAGVMLGISAALAAIWVVGV